MFTESAPRLIQSGNCNFQYKDEGLKQLWLIGKKKKIDRVPLTRVSRSTCYDHLVTQLMQSRLATSEHVLISTLYDRLGRVIQPKLPSSDDPKSCWD